MGSGKAITCESCGDKKMYYLGVGFAFSNVFNIIDQFPLGAQKKIKYISSFFQIERQDMSYEVFECRVCDTSHSRIHLSIKYNNGMVYNPLYRCPECRRKLFKSKRQLQNYKCRRCGKYSLKNSKTKFIIWD